MRKITLQSLIREKDVLYIPIYSMFNHQTGHINMTCDGNINRWITAFTKNPVDEHFTLTVLGPEEKICDNFKQFKKMIKPIRNLKYIQIKQIKKNAGYQRSDIFSNKTILENSELFSTICRNKVIIAEGQGMIRSLLTMRKVFKDNLQENFPKIVYWCPVCQTNTKTRNFFGADDKVENEEIFKLVDNVIVAAKDQVEYLRECGVRDSKIIYHHEFIDRRLSQFSKYREDTNSLNIIKGFQKIKKVVYLPFRLSDEGYKIWEIIEICKEHDVLVVSPNVNGACINELCNLCMTKSRLTQYDVIHFMNHIQSVSSSRDTYYSILDKGVDVIIPYFEDTDFVMHAAVDELISGEKKPVCKIATTREQLVDLLED